MSAITRRKFSPDTPDRARQLAALGLPLAAIAAALGVHRSTLTEWRATEPDLAAAIHDGYLQGQEALVTQLHRAAHNGDTRAATWLLTHSPIWRDHWSDAAALRRAVLNTIGQVVDAVQACPALTPQVRHALLLEMQARGIGATYCTDEIVSEGNADVLTGHT